jgi:hypothetical protein
MGATQFFTLANFSALDPSTTLLVAEVTAAGGGAVKSTNVIALSAPSKWALPNATVAVGAVAADPATGGATVVVSADQTAVYVTLTTLATGRFGENAFVLLPGQPKTVQFLRFEGQPVDLALLESSVRADHLAMYLL